MNMLELSTYYSNWKESNESSSEIYKEKLNKKEASHIGFLIEN